MNQEPRIAEDDGLAAALVWMGRTHNVPIHPKAAMAGLPLPESGKLTPRLFLRAAKQSGLEAKFRSRRPETIPNAILPVVLLSKEGNKAVLMLDKNAEGVTVLDPLLGKESVLSVSDCRKQFSKEVIYVKPDYQPEERVQFGGEEKKGHWFWTTLWSLRGFYGRVAVGTVFINVLALASSLFIMNVYDRVVPNQAVDTLYVLAVGAMVAYVFEFLLKNLRTWLIDRAGHRADLALGSALFEQILGMRYSHKPASVGALSAQARSYEQLREFFTSASVSALVDLPFVFVFALVVYALGGVVVAPMIVGILICLGMAMILQWPIRKAVESAYQASNQRQALVVESIQALETIKICGAESQIQGRMERALAVSSGADGKSRRASQLALHLTGTVQQVVTMAIVIVAFYQVTNGEMTMGKMIAAVILAGRGMAPLAMLASLTTRWQQSKKSLKGLDAIMELPKEKRTGGVSAEALAPSYSLKGVRFSYPNEEELKAIDDVTIAIEAGERVALLGGIGSGKSSMLRLLLGLYEPTEGHVEMGGVDMRQLYPADYRRKIGYMAQDPVLLYGTLRSNLTLGRIGIEDEQLLKALELVGLMDWVNQHPSGLEMTVAEGGASMSGGQRQCVSLAPALVHEPDILILDEPSSGMDSRTEARLIESLQAYLAENANRTLILATHRRSLLALVERVVVLEKGKIFGDGRTDQLVSSAAKRRAAPEPEKVKEDLSESDEEETRRLALSN